jgi:hypothetical protein
VAVEGDAHQVPRLALVPVGRGPNRDHGCHRLAVVEEDLDADPRGAVAQREQVVVECEALRLGPWEAREALRARRAARPAGEIEVAPGQGPVVARDAAVPPAEIVDRGDVGEEAEALDVAEVEAGFSQPPRVDNKGRLAVLVAALDEAGDALEGQEATPRIS